MKLKPGDPVYWPRGPHHPGVVVKTDLGLRVETKNTGGHKFLLPVRGWKRRKVERGGGIAKD